MEIVLCGASACCERALARASAELVLQIILSIGRVLVGLHASGHVHRDLDPRHIMWLPQEQRWTVSGLGSVARTGGTAPLPDTLSPAKRPPSVPVYAAPEAVTAARRGDVAIPTTDALDAWALGVLVIELLAGQSVFKRSAGRDAVRPLTALALPHSRSYRCSNASAEPKPRNRFQSTPPR